MNNIPAKPADVLFTDEQWQAMHQTGNDILVSASAGSGKTLVLINRLVQKILGGSQLDELLVVTFTHAAAQEMKDRLQRELQRAINELESESSSQQKHHLFQQLPKIGQSYISTIHSFCLKVIQNYYYLIDFDPIFRQLTDDTEIEMIKDDIWADLFEEFLEQGTEQERYFALAYSGKRLDDALKEMVFRLLDFARSRPDTEKWLASLHEPYFLPGDSLVDWAFYREVVRPEMLRLISQALDYLDEACAMDDGAKELKTPRSRLEADTEHFKRMKSLIESDELDQAYCVADYSFKAWSNGSGDYKEVGEAMKPFREQAKNLYLELVNKFFAVSPKEQVNAIKQSGEMIKVLADLTSKFSARYQSYKAERQLIDFSDLEHLTLQILRQEDGTPSEAARYYQNLFEEVMVDEYQDTNILQESILQLVTRDEPRNLFMVGDIKQSIYSFRLADPTLFARKYRDFGVGEQGVRIDLLENFRSRPEVLSFTNYLFAQMMDRELGDIDYDEQAALKFGLTQVYEHNPDFQAEVLLFDNESQELGDDDLTSKEGEIHLVAHRIKELVSGTEPLIIYDSDEKVERPAQYKDIVLLTPTKMNNALIQEILQMYQIPVTLNETQNFFQTTEISIVMSLLEIIDNPIQDIPLIAVLRSPIVGLKENELAQIRLQNRYSSFYKALIDFSQAKLTDPRNQKTQNLVQHFITQLDAWRAVAKQVSVAELLRVLYEETGYEIYVAGMPGGQQRQANLRALRERAAAYEQTSFKGLARFIHFVAIMREKDKDLAEPTSSQLSENSVRVMTIHASKGLEFPLVFVMDMSRSFNLKDATHHPYVLDSDYGMGLEYRDLDRNLRISTYPEVFLREKKKKQLIAEEMRVLYVALTRAEQKLFLVGQSKSFADAQKEWEKTRTKNSVLIPAFSRLLKNNYMYWIGLVKMRQIEVKQLAQRTGHIDSQLSVDLGSTDISVQIYASQDVLPPESEVAEERQAEFLERLQSGVTDTEQSQSLQRSLDFAVHVLGYQYPDQAATLSKSTRSVTELKRLFEERESGKIAKLDISQCDAARSEQDMPDKPVYQEDSFKTPRFLDKDETSVDALTIGQATHLLLQTIPLQDTMTADDFVRQGEELVQKGLLQEEVLSHIPYSSLAQFFMTEFGAYILANKDSLHREEAFTMMIPASRLYQGFSGDASDQVIVHGVIDGYIEEADGLTLFDYKTDRLWGTAEENTAELKHRYRGQLTLYRLALENSLQKPVKRSVIAGINVGINIDLI